MQRLSYTFRESMLDRKCPKGWAKFEGITADFFSFTFEVDELKEIKKQRVGGKQCGKACATENLYSVTDR